MEGGSNVCVKKGEGGKDYVNEGNRKRRMVRPSIDETSASVVSTRKGGGGREGRKEVEEG